MPRLREEGGGEMNPLAVAVGMMAAAGASLGAA